MKLRANMKWIVLGLFIIMLGSFAIAKEMFYSPMDFNFSGRGNTYIVDEDESFEIDGLKEISIFVSMPDITIIPVDGDILKIHYNGSAMTNSEEAIPLMTTYKRDEALDVKLERKSFVSTGVFNSNLKLDIYLPRNYKGSLNLTASSGRITFDNLELESLEIKTSSGNVRAGSINADKIDITTSSGRVNIDNAEGNSFVQRSSSGDITIGNIRAKNVVMETSSGRRTINGIKADSTQHRSSSGDMIIKELEVSEGGFTSSSGRVTLENVSGNLLMTSSSGDISVDYLKFENDIKITTSSGKVNMKLPKDSEFRLNVNTNSGRLSTQFPISEGEITKKYITGVVGSSNNKINITTSSGNVSINN